MIVIDLCCNLNHRFEGWFASAAAFDRQRDQGLISCPVCGNTEVRRLPSAPYVQTKTSPAPSVARPSSSAPAADPNQLALIAASIRQMARNAEDVGDDFPTEARRIHRGEREARNIRGAASGDELSELIDEGIMVLPVPPDEDLH
ncbi:DUF1178 family protein [Azoarcus sp. L1K30]|uniref:DUF1178 family protein n=1 Tax=Azoarcus sp. L1K30 TaxID=2820277 RepID=UPI001B82F2EF|nr:DUF1178 family protein [Azoarcus sp. L1K30]